MSRGLAITGCVLAAGCAYILWTYGGGGMIALPMVAVFAVASLAGLWLAVRGPRSGGPSRQPPGPK
jgi:hypothetical protein